MVLKVYGQSNTKDMDCCSDTAVFLFHGITLKVRRRISGRYPGMPSTPAARLFRYGGITSLAGVCRFILKAFTNLIEQPIRKRCRKKSIKEAGTILQSVIQCAHLKLFPQPEFYSSLQSKQFLPQNQFLNFSAHFTNTSEHFQQQRDL